MAGRPAVVSTARGPVEVAELGSGSSILVLHGTMGGWDQAATIARALGLEGHRCLCPSRPGYLGTPLESGRSAPAQADLCAALLDELEIRTVAVIGVSGGSPTALELSLRHPDRVRALVVVSGCAGPAITSTVPLPIRVAAQLTRLPAVARWMRNMWSRDLDSASSFLVPEAELRSRLLADPLDGPFFTDFLLGTVDRLYARLRGTMNDVDTMRVCEHALEALETQTLVVHGTVDHMLSYADNALAFEARLPRAELLTFEGGGHSVMFTHRREVSEAVVDFLRTES